MFLLFGVVTARITLDLLLDKFYRTNATLLPLVIPSFITNFETVTGQSLKGICSLFANSG